MGFLDFLWKAKKKKQKKEKAVLKGFGRLKTEIEALKTEFSNVHTMVIKHESRLADQSLLIEGQGKRIDSLENRLVNQPTKLGLADLSQPNRPMESTNPAYSEVQDGKFDVSMFSLQEKRILSIFFDHSDMALSYADIAQTMGKSPNTIKNQMNQIHIKADLFNASLGNDNRKRFRLKKGLRIEKYLNINRPDRLD